MIQIQIPEKAKYIIETIQSAGFEAYVVGGCVRDSILGRTPEDWDITTSARPEQVKQLFRRTIDTGIQHGTVTVMLDKEGFEVTTYRVDGKDLIKDLQEKYGSQIEILAGSGMNASNAKEMMEYTGIYQVHSSCKDWVNDSTTHRHEVSYAYAPVPHENDYDVVSKELVEKIVKSI